MPKIINGYAGEGHITPNQDRIFNMSLIGSGNWRSSIGGQCVASVLDANTIQIADGQLVVQGVRVAFDGGEGDRVSIANGVSGYKRIDLVVLQYTKNTSTLVEKFELVVIQGQSTTGTPVEPSYTTGDIIAGATLVQIPLCAVLIDGLYPASEDAITMKIAVFDPLQSQIATLGETVSRQPVTLSDTKSYSGVKSGASKTVTFSYDVPAGYRIVGIEAARSLSESVWVGQIASYNTDSMSLQLYTTSTSAQSGTAVCTVVAIPV